MTCQGCVTALTRAMSAVEGVNSAEVSLARAEARVAFDGKTNRQAIEHAIEEVGYTVS